MIKVYSDGIDLYISFPKDLNTFEVIDSETKDPMGCIFVKEYHHDVMNRDGLKEIMFEEVESYKQKAILLFVFGEIKWEW